MNNEIVTVKSKTKKKGENNYLPIGKKSIIYWWETIGHFGCLIGTRWKKVLNILIVPGGYKNKTIL